MEARDPISAARSAAEVTDRLSSERVASGCSEMKVVPLLMRRVCSPPLSTQPRKSAAGAPIVLSAIRGSERSFGMSSLPERKA